MIYIRYKIVRFVAICRFRVCVCVCVCVRCTLRIEIMFKRRLGSVDLYSS